MNVRSDHITYFFCQLCGGLFLAGEKPDIDRCSNTACKHCGSCVNGRVELHACGNALLELRLCVAVILLGDDGHHGGEEVALQHIIYRLGIVIKVFYNLKHVIDIVIRGIYGLFGRGKDQVKSIAKRPCEAGEEVEFICVVLVEGGSSYLGCIAKLVYGNILKVLLAKKGDKCVGKRLLSFNDS